MIARRPKYLPNLFLNGASGRRIFMPGATEMNIPNLRGDIKSVACGSFKLSRVISSF